jgi:hypothetical protein
MITADISGKGTIQLSVDKQDVESIKSWVTEFPELMEYFRRELALKLREYAILESTKGTVFLETSWSEVSPGAGSAYSFYAGIPHIAFEESELYLNVGLREPGNREQLYSDYAGELLSSLTGEDEQSEYSLDVAIDELEPELDRRLTEMVEK